MRTTRSRCAQCADSRCRQSHGGSAPSARRGSFVSPLGATPSERLLVGAPAVWRVAIQAEADGFLCFPDKVVLWCNLWGEHLLIACARRRAAGAAASAYVACFRASACCTSAHSLKLSTAHTLSMCAVADRSARVRGVCALLYLFGGDEAAPYQAGISTCSTHEEVDLVTFSSSHRARSLVAATPSESRAQAGRLVKCRADAVPVGTARDRRRGSCSAPA